MTLPVPLLRRQRQASGIQRKSGRTTNVLPPAPIEDWIPELMPCGNGLRGYRSKLSFNPYCVFFGAAISTVPRRSSHQLFYFSPPTAFSPSLPILTTPPSHCRLLLYLCLPFPIKIRIVSADQIHIPFRRRCWENKFCVTSYPSNKDRPPEIGSTMTRQATSR